jgi:hypothetical protein
MQNPNDPFAFLKAQWADLGSSFQMPQAAMSSLDPQVIDKRIEDLKTVEQWLSFNLNMVKSTIQGLEIQKGTLAAIQSFQQSMQDFGQSASVEGAAQDSTASAGTEDGTSTPGSGLNDAAMAQAAGWWNGMQQQFQHFVQAAQQATDQATSKGSPQAESSKASAQKRAATTSSTTKTARTTKTRSGQKASR